MFLLLVLGVLGLNIYSSYETEVTAEAVNIAGRQRMLSQRTAKALSRLQFKYKANQPFQNHLDELQFASNLFDRSLRAFTEGGRTASTKGAETSLEAVSGQQGIAVLDRANAIWLPFFEDLSSMMAALNSPNQTRSPEDHGKIISRNVEFTEANINVLLGLMNDLTNYQEGLATKAADQSRLIQTAGILASLFCFTVIMLLIMGQLRRADRSAAKAQRETEQIFKTVDQGLFLIDPKLQMGAQHSRELERIFSSTELAGQNFSQFISPLVSDVDLDKVKRYLKLLFDPHKKQRLLNDLNPLNQLPIQVEQNGAFINKYLRFSFSRVLKDKEIERILVSVADITKEIKLAKNLESETRRNEQQLEMISTLLGADAESLPGFISHSDSNYQEINNILRDPARNSIEFIRKADSILTLIHGVKGESAALGLGIVASTCHDFESRIDHLKEKPVLAGGDFLSLTVLLDRLISINDQIKAVSSIVKRPTPPENNIEEGSPTCSQLLSLAEQMSKRQGKKVNVDIAGFDNPTLNLTSKADVISLTSQLLRNAISHGIEQPEFRKKSGKSEIGHVSIALYRDQLGGLKLTCEDDGTGVDFDTLTDKALAQGLIKQDKAHKTSTQSILNLMLANRLSSRDTVDQDSGRGAGLSVVGATASKIGATLALQTGKGKGTRFTLKIPNPASAPNSITTTAARANYA